MQCLNLELMLQAESEKNVDYFAKKMI